MLQPHAQAVLSMIGTAVSSVRQGEDPDRQRSGRRVTFLSRPQQQHTPAAVSPFFGRLIMPDSSARARTIPLSQHLNTAYGVSSYSAAVPRARRHSSRTSPAACYSSRSSSPERYSSRANVSTAHYSTSTPSAMYYSSRNPSARSVSNRTPSQERYSSRTLSAGAFSNRTPSVGSHSSRTPHEQQHVPDRMPSTPGDRFSPKTTSQGRQPLRQRRPQTTTATNFHSRRLGAEVYPILLRRDLDREKAFFRSGVQLINSLFYSTSRYYILSPLLFSA